MGCGGRRGPGTERRWFCQHPGETRVDGESARPASVRSAGEWSVSERRTACPGRAAHPGVRTSSLALRLGVALCWAIRVGRSQLAVGSIPRGRTAFTNIQKLESFGERMRLAEIADQLHRNGIFTGGPPHLFESAGRLQLSTLVREGINPSSKLLDVGCGCLRAGYWLVRLLDAGCYFGIEPNSTMLQAGLDHVLGSELQAAKKPLFDTNDRFDFSV